MGALVLSPFPVQVRPAYTSRLLPGLRMERRAALHCQARACEPAARWIDVRRDKRWLRAEGAEHAVQVTKEEYGRFGQGELGRLLLEKLQSEGKKPYLIPVGGSSGVGSWGYLQAWQEILAQSQEQPFTDVVMVLPSLPALACQGPSKGAVLCALPLLSLALEFMLFLS